MFLIVGACKMFCGKVGIPEFCNVGLFFFILALFFSGSGFIRATVIIPSSNFRYYCIIYYLSIQKRRPISAGAFYI